MVDYGLVAAGGIGRYDHWIELGVDRAADRKYAGDSLGMERQNVVDEGRTGALAYKLEVVDDAETLQELVIHFEVSGSGIRPAVSGIDDIYCSEI